VINSLRNQSLLSTKVKIFFKIGQQLPKLCTISTRLYETQYSSFVMKVPLKISQPTALCGLRGCKNRPAPFPGRMSYKTTKPGPVYLYPSVVLWLCCCLLKPLLRIVSLCWYVLCLLLVLVKLSVHVNWLARKTPLRKPNRGEGIISTKPRP